jgi:hypothetical protein
MRNAGALLVPDVEDDAGGGAWQGLARPNRRRSR